jgi:hypothetical protein
MIAVLIMRLLLARSAKGADQAWQGGMNSFAVYD